MSAYRYFLSLRFYHPSLNLSIVTNTLGLMPKLIDTAGQPRIRKSNPIGAISDESYWTHEFDLNESEQDLEDCLLEHAEKLEPYKELFDTICNTGGQAEFFIGFMLESFNTGFILSPELQSKCAKLNISLSLDIYDSDKKPVDAV